MEIDYISSDNSLSLSFYPCSEKYPELEIDDEEILEKYTKSAEFCFSIKDFNSLIMNAEKFLNELKEVKASYEMLNIAKLDIIDVNLD